MRRLIVFLVALVGAMGLTVGTAGAHGHTSGPVDEYCAGDGSDNCDAVESIAPGFPF